MAAAGVTWADVERKHAHQTPQSIQATARPSGQAHRPKSIAHKDTYRLASRSGSVIQHTPASPWLPFTATWYDARGDAMNGGDITALGNHVKPSWTVAVDPNVIPLGSLIEVRFGDGSKHLYQAQDTGTAIQGRRVDIYDPDSVKCQTNGVQTVEIRVVDAGNSVVH